MKNTFNLVTLAKTEPLNILAVTDELARFYTPIIRSLTNEKLAVDYIELVKYTNCTAPANQKPYLVKLSNSLFFEAQRRNLVDEIEAMS